MDSPICVGHIASPSYETLAHSFWSSFAMQQQARHSPPDGRFQEAAATLFLPESGIKQDALPFEQQRFGTSQAFRVSAVIPLGCVDLLANISRNRLLGWQSSYLFAHRVGSYHLKTGVLRQAARQD